MTFLSFQNAEIDFIKYDSLDIKRIRDKNEATIRATILLFELK